MLSPPPLPADDMERVLAELAAIYAAELPELIERVAGLTAQAARSPEAARAARVAAHQLRGTAGSYGFTAVGEAAGRIEDALDGDPGERPDPADLDELTRALVLLSPDQGGSSGSSK